MYNVYVIMYNVYVIMYNVYLIMYNCRCNYVYVIMYNVYLIMYNVTCTLYIIRHTLYISVRATSLSVMQLFSYPRKINNKVLLKHDLAEVNVIIVIIPTWFDIYVATVSKGSL